MVVEGAQYLEPLIQLWPETVQVGWVWLARSSVEGMQKLWKEVHIRTLHECVSGRGSCTHDPPHDHPVGHERSLGLVRVDVPPLVQQ